ncbi:MAG: hypothetical protein ACMXX9_02395 [Candidatus Woesearchaeota archaeon]
MNLNNKKGQTPQTIIGAVLFVFILFLLITEGVFGDLINAFEESFGTQGFYLGVLIILIIILAILQRLLGR